MQIQTNRINNTGFGAKLNVTGAKFDKKVMAALSEKADKIGCEDDLVELNFTKLYSILDRNYHWHGLDNHHINEMYTEFRQTFKARFLQNRSGKSSEQVSDKLFARSDYDIFEQQKQVANNYLDNLTQKYKI